MDDISYVAAVGASAVAGLVTWLAYGRYHSRLQRVLFGAIAFLLGFVVYFVLGFVFIIVRPDVAHETGLAIGNGVKVLTVMLVVVNVVVLTIRGRAGDGRSKE